MEAAFLSADPGCLQTHSDRIDIRCIFQRRLRCNIPSAAGFHKRILHRHHAGAASRLNHTRNLEGLVVPDQASNRGIAMHHLKAGNSSLLIRPGKKPL